MVAAPSWPGIATSHPIVQTKWVCMHHSSSHVLKVACPQDGGAVCVRGGSAFHATTSTFVSNSAEVRGSLAWRAFFTCSHSRSVPLQLGAAVFVEENMDGDEEGDKPNTFTATTCKFIKNELTYETGIKVFPFLVCKMLVSINVGF